MAGSELPDDELITEQGAWDEIESVDVKRNYLIRSVISSLVIEGVYISYAEASRILDEVETEPLADIGSRREASHSAYTWRYRAGRRV